MKAVIKHSLLFIAILLLVFLYSCQTQKTEEITPATIDVLKIGKADCIVINTGSKIVMIDTGEEENVANINDYMSNKGYDKIDTLILTHYDKDHIGGAASIIADYKVETIIESKFTSGSEYYSTYRNAINEQGAVLIKLSENYTLVSDSCEFKIDTPKNNKYEKKQDNNISLIVSMKCGENRFLFCGDAMEERINEFIKDNQNSYNLVKLPYHGNYLENYKAFLDSVNAKYGVITNSNKNPASEETLSALNEYSISTYQTRYGTVYITTNGKEITITQK